MNKQDIEIAIEHCFDQGCIGCPMEDEPCDEFGGFTTPGVMRNILMKEYHHFTIANFQDWLEKSFPEMEYIAVDEDGYTFSFEYEPNAYDHYWDRYLNYGSCNSMFNMEDTKFADSFKNWDWKELCFKIKED